MILLKKYKIFQDARGLYWIGKIERKWYWFGRRAKWVYFRGYFQKYEQALDCLNANLQQEFLIF